MNASQTAVSDAKRGTLAGLRVIELADELGEYCGLLLAGQGAEVIKLEPPEGASTRRIGPFHDDCPDPERSLHFWAHNRGKRSVVCDLGTVEGRSHAQRLIESADVLLDSTGGRTLAALGTSHCELRSRMPALITARITPFGDEGPWRDWRGSDLVHLALGGIMMNCGYDPDPSGHYDLPPIAPQLWHAYYITGEQMFVGWVAQPGGAAVDVTCWIACRAPVDSCESACSYVSA